MALDSLFKRCNLNGSQVSLWCVMPEHASTCIQPWNVLSEEKTKFMQNCTWPVQPAAPRGHSKPASTHLPCHFTQTKIIHVSSFSLVDLSCISFFGFIKTIPCYFYTNMSRPTPVIFCFLTLHAQKKLKK